MQRREVVVIGGGITGSAAAYELASAGARVTLLEKGSLASMASGWTLGGVRQSGRHPAELPLARAAVQQWAGLAQELGQDVEYRRRGNLRLARTPEEVPVIAAMVEEQRALGLDLDFLPDNSAIRAVAPAIAETVLAASYCPTDGHANPVKTVHAFAAAAERAGAVVRTGSLVTGIDAAGGRVRGVRTSSGAIAADAVVVAAGVYTGQLCAPLGIDIPIRVEHVAIVQTVPAPPVIEQVLGVANADFAGRQEVDGRLRLSGIARAWESPDGLATEDSVQPTARAVVDTLTRAIAVLPAVATARIGRVWGGLLDMTPDALPVIEAVPEVEGLVVAAGYSGHGFCLGPVSGRIIRELVMSGESTLPIAPFRHDRFATIQVRAEPTLHG